MPDNYPESDSIDLDVYKNASGLEQGIYHKEKLQDNDKQSLISSVFKEMTSEIRSSLPEVNHTIHIQNPPNTSYIHKFADPLHFLKKEQISQDTRLQDLLNEHRTDLQSGNPNVGKVRRQLISLIHDKCNNYQAMKEIYVSKSTNRTRSLKLFEEWEQRKRGLSSAMEEICNKSMEGQNYMQRSKDCKEIDEQIVTLESQLHSLREKRATIAKQCAESKSLLEAKVHIYDDALEQINDEETNAISRLQNDKLLRQGVMSGPAVIENLRLSNEALDDLVDTSTNMENKLHDTYDYLTGIFDMLSGNEKRLQEIAQSGDVEEIKENLLETKNYLADRYRECQKLKLEEVQQIILNEYDIMIRALNMISAEQYKNELEVPIADKQPHQFDKLKKPVIQDKDSDSNSMISTVIAKGNIIPTKSDKYTLALNEMKKHKGTKRD